MANKPSTKKTTSSTAKKKTTANKTTESKAKTTAKKTTKTSASTAKKTTQAASTAAKSTSATKKPTTTAKKPATRGRKPIKTLKGISDIRRHFHRNEQPIFFISATNFNLLGLDEWCKNFKFISYIDCFDGRHPNVFVPTEQEHPEFESIEDIVVYLLEHKEVIELLKASGKRPKAVFLMFDKRVEKICRELGIDVWFPKASLREKIDHKIETVRIGNAAGVPSVPNVLSKIKDWDHLQKVAKNIGNDLVLQSAFGDSGHTTFFISNEQEFKQYESEIVGKGEIKVMKRINNRGTAVEACATKAGTLVGPMMTELVGFKPLTPYRGGWCGNEIFPDAFDENIRDKARQYTEQFGNQLVKEGYRGYFELDFLIDKDDGEVYLGECNPRVTGASSMTNHAAFAHADAPLFLFHLLEFSNIPFEIDVKELNARWADADNIDEWCQMVIKHTDDSVDILTHAPETGIYKLNPDGSVNFDRFDYHRRAVASNSEAFFLRILKPGDYRYKGADLGILVTRGRAMGKGFHLNKRSKQWIEGIKQNFHAKSITAATAITPQDPQFKIM